MFSKPSLGQLLMQQQKIWTTAKMSEKAKHIFKKRIYVIVYIF